MCCRLAVRARSGRPKRGGLLLAALAACGLALAACGGGSHPTPAPHAAAYVDIYSSLPLQGPQAARGHAVQSGIELALQQAQGRAGRFRVRYRALDDASAAAGGFSVGQIERDARQAAADPLAVYYIGELGSAASEVSMPVLNDAGIAQLSPSASYVGLTAPLPGAAAGDPQRLRPSGRVTFASLLPNDDVEAAALLQVMRELGCRRIAVAYQPPGASQVGFYGAGQAQTVQALAHAYGATVLTDAPAPAASDARTYALSLRRRRPQCFMLAGSQVPAAATLLDAVHTVAPGASLLVSHQLCDSALVAALSTSAAPRLQCTRPIAPVDSYPGGRAFAAAYQARFHRAPSTWSLYGYVAMDLGLRTIASLGAAGDDRGAVLHALLSSQARRSAIGRLGFDADGETTLRTLWLYTVGAGGHLDLSGSVVPSRVPNP
jgi:branched-chain amino acid transport system substrate-binding protein